VIDIRQLFSRLFEPASAIPISHKAVRHLLVGGFGTVFYFAIVAALVEKLGMDPVVSVVIGFVVLHVYVYLMNRTWVYGATNKHVHALVRFGILVGISFFLNTAIMYITTEVLNSWYVWGLIFATILVPATNFVLSYFWVFR